MGKAKGAMSGSRIIQNKEAARIAKELGITDKNKIQQIHRYISGEGWDYQTALQEVKYFLGL